MVSHRFSWVLALLVIVVSGALMALIGDDASSQQSPVPVPTSAESARADALRAQFPGGDRVPAIVVVSRRDGDALSPADLAAVHQGPLQLSERPLRRGGCGTDGRQSVRFCAQRRGQVGA